MSLHYRFDMNQDGIITITDRMIEITRVAIADSYPNDLSDLSDWLASEGVPDYGDAHPDMADLTLKRREIRGFGTKLDNEDPAYAQALVTLVYNNEASDFEYVRKSSSTEILSITGENYTRVNVPFGIERIDVPFVRFVDSAAHYTCKDKLNNAALYLPDELTPYPTGTVLYLGRDLTRRHDPALGTVFDIIFHFLANDRGWNTVWEPGTGFVTADPLIYASADLSALFTG